MPPVLRPAPQSSASPSPTLRSPAAAGFLRFARRRFSSVAAASGGGRRVRVRREGCGVPGEGERGAARDPGVRPRNLRKLVDGGFRDLVRLKQLYTDKVGDRCQFSENSSYIMQLKSSACK